MENRNFKSYTVQDLVNKMKKKLRQKYKQEKDKSSRSGTGKRKKWKLFEIIDRTLCDISPSVFFFSFRQDVDQFPCLIDDDSSWFDLSHILLLRCHARWRQAVYPPFTGNKTDRETGRRLKIGTVPSWRKTFYFGSCKWAGPCRNGLGTVPKIWRAVPCRFFSACKWGFRRP